MSSSFLISKKKGDDTFPYYYKLGWLMKGKDNAFHWLIMASVNSVENAIKAAKNIFCGKGEIYLSEEPLSETLTEDEFACCIKQVD